MGGRTSTQAKSQWNARNYKQIKVSVKPNTASAFKAACSKANMSMTGILSEFMDEYSNTITAKKGYAPDLSTRRQRRAAIKNLLHQLKRVRDGEERYRNSIPENLQSSPACDTADQCISLLDEAIDLLEAAY